MPTTLTSMVLMSVVLLAQVATPPPTPPAVGPAKPPAQSGAARPGSLALTVSTEGGQSIANAGVVVHGLVERAGSTGADGVLTLINMPAGTYRCRIVRDGFITLEKDVTIRAGARTTTEGVLSAAPTPPPLPAPPPADTRPAAPSGKPGVPRVASIAEMADQMIRELKDTQPIIDREIGCAMATSTRLIVARENIALHRHADVDEVLYMMAGEATLAMGDKDQVVVAGWVGLAPRGTAHSLTRRGRSPIAILSVQSGVACSAS